MTRERLPIRNSRFAVRVRGVGKVYRVRSKRAPALCSADDESEQRFWALRDVTFDVAKGEAVGVIGRNGSGKSTLLQIVAGTISPTCGEVELWGRVGAVLELGSGFNPELSGRRNVFLNAALLGLTRRQALEYFDRIVAFADIGDFIGQPVKLYSSGMLVRLAFAIQTALDPDVLIIDEALSVGDYAFQKKCVRHLEERLAQGLSALVVSHDTALVKRVCNRVLVLHEGRVVADAAPLLATQKYLSQFAMAARHDQVSDASADVRTPRSAQFRALLAQSSPRPDALPDPTASVELLGLVIEDMAGQPCVSVEHGERVKVSAVLRCTSAVSEVHMRVWLTDTAGTPVWSSCTIEARGLQPGRAYVSGVQLTLNLGPGHYRVNCALGVSNADSHPLSEEDSVVRVADLQVREFDLGPNEPVPFWGLSPLPFNVQHLTVLGVDAESDATMLDGPGSVGYAAAMFGSHSAAPPGRWNG